MQTDLCIRVRRRCHYAELVQRAPSMCRRIVRQHTSAYVSIRTSAYASAGAAIMRKLVHWAPSICRRIEYSRHRLVVLTILPSGEAVRPHIRLATRLLCQYLYFCTSKASKLGSLSTRVVLTILPSGKAVPPHIRLLECVSICTFVPVKQVNFVPVRVRKAINYASPLKRVSVFVLLY